MGIFGAMTSAVAGLRAQSYALENISGNIAGSQTPGFKRVDTSFIDLVPDTSPVAQLAGSVTGVSRATNTVKGDLQPASEKTFMAINGEGFFVVQKPATFSDNNPVFDGVDHYTRRGDFSRDKDGFLVNKAGYFLEGIPIDPVSGNTIGNTPQVLQFSNDFLPAAPTTAVNYRANLPLLPKNSHTVIGNLGSGLLSPGDFGEDPSILGTPAQLPASTTTPLDGKARKDTANNPITVGTNLVGPAPTINPPFIIGDTITIRNTTTNAIVATHTVAAADTIADLLATIDGATGGAPATITGGVITLHGVAANGFAITSPNNPQAFNALGFGGSGQITAADEPTFISESVSGGSITGFDTTGSPVNIVLRWAKLDSDKLGAGHTDQWNLFYQVDSQATGTQTAWANVGKDFFFQNGVQIPPPVSSVTLTTPTIDGVTLSNDVTFTFGDTGLTQFDDKNGAVKPTQFLQDGSPAGQLVDIAVSDEGRVVGSFSNGKTRDLAQITLVTFSGTNFLKRLDGGAFEATDASGLPLVGATGVVGAHLENSNSDIADEFTKMILTQQAYSACSKMITTANEMARELTDAIR